MTAPGIDPYKVLLDRPRGRRRARSRSSIAGSRASTTPTSRPGPEAAAQDARAERRDGDPRRPDPPRATTIGSAPAARRPTPRPRSAARCRRHRRARPVSGTPGSARSNRPPGHRRRPGRRDRRPCRATGRADDRRSVAGTTPTRMRTADGDGAAGPPPGNPSGTVLNFGRYAGWSLGEIARQRPRVPRVARPDGDRTGLPGRDRRAPAASRTAPQRRGRRRPPGALPPSLRPAGHRSIGAADGTSDQRRRSGSGRHGCPAVRALPDGATASGVSADRHTLGGSVTTPRGSAGC